MDRKALSKRLEGLSSVFASETPIATDLKAMAYTLDKMSDDKFKTILSSEYESDEEREAAKKTEDLINEDLENSVEAEECEKDKNASEDGLYWNREASDIVLASLVKDVTGAELKKEQTPDGCKKAEKPFTLKDDQTPKIDEVLKSKIVEKSHGAVKKEAGAIEGPGVPDGTGPMKDSPECKKNKDKEKAEKEAGAIEGPGVPDGTGPMRVPDGTGPMKDSPECKKNKDKEKAEKESPVEAAAKQDMVQTKKDESGEVDPENMAKPARESGSMEDMAKSENKEAYVSEGVELNAPMIDVSLDAKEAEDLGKLFS